MKVDLQELRKANDLIKEVNSVYRLTELDIINNGVLIRIPESASKCIMRYHDTADILLSIDDNNEFTITNKHKCDVIDPSTDFKTGEVVLARDSLDEPWNLKFYTGYDWGHQTNTQMAPSIGTTKYVIKLDNYNGTDKITPLFNWSEPKFEESYCHLKRSSLVPGKVILVRDNANEKWKMRVLSSFGGDRILWCEAEDIDSNIFLTWRQWALLTDIPLCDISGAYDDRNTTIDNAFKSIIIGNIKYVEPPKLGEIVLHHNDGDDILSLGYYMGRSENTGYLIKPCRGDVPTFSRLWVVKLSDYTPSTGKVHKPVYKDDALHNAYNALKTAFNLEEYLSVMDENND